MTATCPACGQSGASFSKSQSRKRQSDRKCTACVRAMLGGSGGAGPTGAPPAPAPRRSTAAASSLSPPQTHGLSSPAKKGKKRRRGKGGGDGDEAMTPTNANDGDGEPQTGGGPTSQKTSKYFGGKPSSAKENFGNRDNGGGEDDEGTGAKVRAKDSDSDSDDNEGGWSPLQDEAEARAEIDKHLGATMEGGGSIGLEDTPAAASRKPTNGKTNVRDKMKRARERALANEDGDPEMEESLEAMKRRILGRPVHSMYDAQDAEEAVASRPSPPGPVADAQRFPDGAKLADRLRQDLTCPICHERLYDPASLLCGHTFCRACLTWWLERKGQQQRNEADDDGESEEEDEEEHGNNRNGGTCPTCREPIPSSDNEGGPNVRANTALKAVLDALFGAEMHRRRLAEERRRRRARGGEHGGRHARGCEELEPLPEEDELECLRGSKTRGSDADGGWIRLHSKTDRPGWRTGSSQYRHSGAGISIRRNVVLDDADQRYQLSLGLTRCTYARGTSARGVLDVELCLLSMEEDEVDDSGFPAFVCEGDDDEALICAGSDRVHTLIESVARVAPASALDRKESNVFGRGDDGSGVRDLPLSRGMIGQDGAVRFRIDVARALEGALEKGEELRVAKLRFRHADTGAVLELRLPSETDAKELRRGRGDAEIEYGSAREPLTAARYMLDDRAEDEEGDEPNEYEEDGFLVHGSQESEEGSGSDEDREEEEDDGHCQICDSGGDLLVCDGGNHAEGCGRMYHVRCIGRRAVPEGDWVCCDCACGVGLSVGIEGHEYELGGGGEAEASRNEPLEIDDDSDSDDGLQEAASGKGEALVVDDSDDDEVVPKANGKKRRKILEVDESDSDSE